MLKEPPTSEPYTIRDPAKVMERRQRTDQLRIAQRIANLPEELWRDKVKLEKPDSQEPIWEFLRAIRTARQLGLQRR